MAKAWCPVVHFEVCCAASCFTLHVRAIKTHLLTSCVLHQDLRRHHTGFPAAVLHCSVSQAIEQQMRWQALPSSITTANSNVTDDHWHKELCQVLKFSLKRFEQNSGWPGLRFQARQLPSQSQPVPHELGVINTQDVCKTPRVLGYLLFARQLLVQLKGLIMIPSSVPASALSSMYAACPICRYVCVAKLATDFFLA